LASCHRTSDLYVVDDSFRICVLRRREEGDEDTLDRMLSGDEGAISSNPSLYARWARVVAGASVSAPVRPRPVRPVAAAAAAPAARPLGSGHVGPEPPPQRRMRLA
jgi:hypothetical protein